MTDYLLVILTMIFIGMSGSMILSKSERHPSLYTGLVMVFFSVLVGMLILCLDAYAGDPRVHVAVIDTGVEMKLVKPYMCSDGNLDLTGMGLEDVSGHGTNIAGIIAHKIDTKTHCLQIIKWWHNQAIYNKISNGQPQLTEMFLKATAQAKKFHAKYVNMSLAGNYGSNYEQRAILELLDSGAIVVVAAGNETKDLDKDCTSFPACYSIIHPNYHVVSAYDVPSSNYGGFTVKETGHNVEGFGSYLSGTSQATAVYMSKLIK